MGSSQTNQEITKAQQIVGKTLRKMLTKKNVGYSRVVHTVRSNGKNVTIQIGG